MPRLKQGNEDKCATNFRARIAYLLAVNRMTKSDLLEKIGMSRTTFYTKECDPRRFTFGELRLIANTLNVPPTTLIEAYAA